MDKRMIYTVADHRFAVVAGEALLGQMAQYEPFAVEPDAAPVLFTLTVAQEQPFPDVDIMVETSQDDEGSQILVGHTADGRSSYVATVLAVSWYLLTTARQPCGCTSTNYMG